MENICWKQQPSQTERTNDDSIRHCVFLFLCCFCAENEIKRDQFFEKEGRQSATFFVTI